uniref:Cytochrome b561 domain-containing protein n=1 Tax=Kwoniella dejecticola CBS 10117 TaxID=1296121 RepID=A0A1A6A3K9_9TREE|nr:uncharacterized protein I303_05499 [Kwoniella dejecticola CBS 10117]OBR84640.1 hypothetical protein I303_05499 [Kwoniella dejecticola CBS 10117]
MKNILPSVLVVALTIASTAQAAITGQQNCNRYMCITGQHDSDKNLDTYTLAPPSGTDIPLSQFGWIAIGFGNSMINSPMVIAWPNSDGSITLSQRKANNHVTPAVDSNPPRKASLLTSSSFSNSSSTSITFTIPSSSNTNSTNLIWAYGNKNPGTSNSGTSNLAQHLASGNTQIALLATELPTSTSSGAGGTTSATGNGPNSGNLSTGVSKNILVAHVVCGALATMLILPIGILIPRIARGFTMKRWWFPAHGAMNGLIAFALIVTAFGIARANFSGGFTSTHRKLGLTLFILAIFQVILGILTHWWQPKHKFQTSSGRGPVNFLHMILGVTIVGVGFGTVWWGIDEEWERWSGTGAPNVGWKVGWGLVVGITALAYLGGLYLLPRQLKMEKERRHWASTISSGGGKTMMSNPKFATPPPPPPVHPTRQGNSAATIPMVQNEPQRQGSVGRVIRDPNYMPSNSRGPTTTGTATVDRDPSYKSHIQSQTQSQSQSQSPRQTQTQPPSKRRLPPAL